MYFLALITIISVLKCTKTIFSFVYLCLLLLSLTLLYSRPPIGAIWQTTAAAFAAKADSALRGFLPTAFAAFSLLSPSLALSLSLSFSHPELRV